MTIKEYLSFVSNKLEEAEKEDDRAEWIRLANVLISTLQDEIEKLRKEEEGG